MKWPAWFQCVFVSIHLCVCVHENIVTSRLIGDSLACHFDKSTAGVCSERVTNSKEKKEYETR